MYEHMIDNIKTHELEASKRMLVLNMLRILPYSTTSTTTEVIEQNLQFLKKEFIRE